MSSITSSNLDGVDRGVRQKVFIANLLSFCNLFSITSVLSSCAHTRAPYVNIGLTIPSYAHRISLGHGPQLLRVRLLTPIIAFFADLIFDSTCVFQWSLQSSSTPKYLTLCEYSRILFSKRSQCVGSLRFLVNLSLIHI